MKLALVFTLFLSLPSPFAFASDGVFRLHLFSEPHSLDSQTNNAASGNYLVHSVYRGLMKILPDGRVVPEGAESCEMKAQTVTCRIASHHIWSDGRPVEANDYLRSFRRLINAKFKSPLSQLLFSVRGARAIWAGTQSPESLGVVAKDSHTLVFTLVEPDTDFLYKLALPALAPLRGEPPPIPKASTLIGSGPYRIREWHVGNRVLLEANPYYPHPGSRPRVEMLFIEEDSTALRLYERGELSLLRRLDSVLIPAYRKRSDFLQMPMARFDYLGFSPALAGYPKLREALARSLEYSGFQQIAHGDGKVGCPGLPATLYAGPLCDDFNAAAATRLLREQPWPEGLPKELGLSRMGGGEVLRAAEWFQGQWKKNLGLSIDVDAQEQPAYLSRLKTSPPPIFRKGIGLDRPTCLSALENFVKGSPENYIGMDSPRYDDVVNRLRSEGDPLRQRQLCTDGLKMLIDDHRIVPLGEMQFTLLASPAFAGWTLNSINQLDLGELHSAK